MSTKANKFVEAVEIVKPGKFADRFIGIELERSKEKVSLLCVDTDSVKDILIEELDLNKFTFKKTEKDRVHHLFSIATKRVSVDVINAEVDLVRARRNLRFCENSLKNNFGGMIKIEEIEQ